MTDLKKYFWNKNVKVVPYHNKYYLTNSNPSRNSFMPTMDFECTEFLYLLSLFMIKKEKPISYDELNKWYQNCKKEKLPLPILIEYLKRKSLMILDQDSGNNAELFSAWDRNYLVDDRIFSTPLKEPTPGILNIFGVPICSTPDSFGSQFSPGLIRSLLVEPYYSKNYNNCKSDFEEYNNLQIPLVSDFGDINVEGSPSLICNNLEKNLKEIIKFKNTKIIFLGGDHSILSICAKACFNDQEFNLIHFDAHSDASFVNGDIFNHANPINYVLEKCPKSRIFSFGLRTGADFREVESNAPKPELTHKDRLTQFSIDETIQFINSGSFDDLSIDKSLPCYLSIDLDVLDPNKFPWVSTPLRDGLSVNDFLKLLDKTCESLNPRFLDIVELNLIKSNDINKLEIADLFLMIIIRFAKHF